MLLIAECHTGFYGVACKEICGNCRDVNQCDHTNGTCLTGCVSGYMGDLCQTRECTNKTISSILYGNV